MYLLIPSLTVFALVVLCVVNYLKHRDFLYPPLIQSILWLIILTLFIINSSYYVNVSSYIYLIILTGGVGFSLGGFMASYGLNLPNRKLPIIIYKKSLFVDFLYYASMMAIPFLIYQRYTLGISGVTENYYANVRIGLQESGVGILEYMGTIVLASLSIHTLLYSKKYKKRMTIVLVITFIYAVLTTGRSFFLQVMCVSLGVLLITRRVTVSKALLKGGFVVLLSFAALAILLEKGTSSDGGLHENYYSLIENFRDYLLGGVPSLHIYTSQLSNFEFGDNTFRFFYAVLNRIGFDVNVIPGTTDFVLMPRRFNVYTFHYPYYVDFGILGVILFSFFIGFIQTYIYRKAVFGNSFYILLYAVLLFPLLMQFFHDQYFTLLSLWMQFFIIYYVFSSKITGRKIK